MAVESIGANLTNSAAALQNAGAESAGLSEGADHAAAVSGPR